MAQRNRPLWIQATPGPLPTLSCWKGFYLHLDSTSLPSGLQWKFPPLRSPLTKPEATSAPRDLASHGHITPWSCHLASL